MDQRRCCGFSVAACNGDHLRRAVKCVPIVGGVTAEKQPDVVIHGHASGPRQHDNRVWCGIKMRNSGANDQGRDILKCALLGQVVQQQPLPFGTQTSLFAVVPAKRLRPAFFQRMRRSQSRASKAQDRNPLTLKTLHRDHRRTLLFLLFINIQAQRLTAYRTLSVARPIIARMSEIIQNRITICGSAHPFFS